MNVREIPGKYKAENIELLVRRNRLASPVYVGDTQGDADASREAGVPFIFAAYGFGNADSCAARADSFSQLPDVLEQFDNRKETVG